MLGLGLVLGLFSALLDMFRTRSPMVDRLQHRNNSHGLFIYHETRLSVGTMDPSTLLALKLTLSINPKLDLFQNLGPRY